MKYAKMLGVAALMLTTFSIATATASAEETSLPSFLALPGVTSFEAKAESKTAKTKFTGIDNLEGEGYKFLLEATNMGELGIGHFWFLEVVLANSLGKKCLTSTDTAGNVLFEAEYHIVLVLSGTSTLYGLLVLLPNAGITIECEGGLKLVVKGTQLSDISTAGNTEVLLISGSTGACNGSIPAYKEYDNMSGGMTTVELKSTAGGITAKSCEEIEGTTEFISTQKLELMEP